MLVQFRLLMQRLNDLPLFDTARWPAREWGTRLAAIAAVAYGLFGKISRFPDQLRGVRSMTASLTAAGCPVAAARTVGALTVLAGMLVILIFLAYMLAWATRVRARQTARGFMEVVFPLLIAALPLLLGGPQTLSRWLAPGSKGFIAALFAVNLLLAGGFLVILVAILNLRTSFSLMAEARPLVRNGLFRWMRHPIYTGNFIMLLGVMLLHLGARQMLVYAGVVIGHFYRARLEESKLSAIYPEYEEYRRITGMFLPGPRRPLTLSPPRLAADQPQASI